VIVPFGLVPNAPGATAVPGGRGAGPNNTPFPPGFDAKPEPYGVSFTGMACSEPKLIELAYAFEQATKKRIPPPLFP
jgi:amidase